MCGQLFYLSIPFIICKFVPIHVCKNKKNHKDTKIKK